MEKRAGRVDIMEQSYKKSIQRVLWTILFCTLFITGQIGLTACAENGLEAKAQVHEQWESEGAFYAKVTITLFNQSDTSAENWKIIFPLPEGGKIQDIWNGVQSAEEENITITAASYNSVIPAGETAEVGFIIHTAEKLDLPQVEVTADMAGQAADVAEQTEALPLQNLADEKHSCFYDGKGVSVHGQLRVEGTQLVDAQGKPVVLHGMSSHGIAWYPQFTNKHTLKSIKEKGANVFRAAMYTAENGGYCEGNAQEAKRLTFDAVDRAIALDMYVVLDWHILSDNTPQIHKEEALQFFQEASARYAGNPAVIYEICNEPNSTDWSSQIKPYAMEVIPIIRRNSPDAVILVGCNTWCQDVDVASMDKLDFENVMYSFHFYSGTHMQNAFCGKIETALNNGCGIFVSEWGTSRADGSDGVFLEESQRWLDYLDEKGISWINWSLSDKDESSAAFRPGTDSETFGAEDLSESGKYVFDALNCHK